MRWIWHFIVASLAIHTVVLTDSAAFAADARSFSLALRSRARVAQAADRFELVEKRADWRPEELAIIVIDVWDHHWCKGAEERLAPLLPRMNALLKEARQRGALIIHAPSGVVSFYEQTPQRALAKNAPLAQLPAPLKGWNYLDRSVEAALPIDDTDGGCNCEPRCSEKPYPWTRQHPAIEIGPDDPISDKGQEIYNLLRQRNIRHVMVLGVHANMCILGRPFGIRQLVRWGFDTALVRDLTDTMYNSRKAPFVAHEKGTELVIEHTEKYWCPSIVSDQILGDSKKN
jgi:nicotinamidase-related amidase